MVTRRVVTRTVEFDTPAKQRAALDTLCALGLTEQDCYDDAKVKLVFERLGELESIAAIINYALHLQQLERPQLKTKMLEYWGAPFCADVVHKLSHLDNGALLRFNVYVFARHLYGDDIALGGAYKAMMTDSVRALDLERGGVKCLAPSAPPPYP